MENKIKFNTLNKYQTIKGNTDHSNLVKNVVFKKIIVKGGNPNTLNVLIKHTRINGSVDLNNQSLLIYREDFVPDIEMDTFTLDISKNDKFQDTDAFSTVEMMIAPNEKVDNLDVEIVCFF